MADAAEIQQRYVAELRGILPDVMTWWNEALDHVSPETLWAHWPTGPSGHPRVLHVFRKYFLAIEAMNRNAEESFQEDLDKPGTDMWGIRDLGVAPDLVRPVDALILEIPDVAPDLSEIVRGICFVPVGLDHNEESV
jgi:hypothetical protein